VKGKHFALLIIATVLTCGFVWVRLQIISISYDINELAREDRSLREDCNNLTLRINEAKSPHRLERIATTKFDMFPPRPGQTITLSER
jgi:cell division protein FtsL